MLYPLSYEGGGWRKGGTKPASGIEGFSVVGCLEPNGPRCRLAWAHRRRLPTTRSPGSDLAQET